MTLELVFINRVIVLMAIVVGFANIGLLSGLLYFYWNSYKELKSKFTTGLIYFAFILLVENILAIMALAVFAVLGIEMHEVGATYVYFILLFVTIAQLIALIILFKITWE
jgi:hypothetical protein